MQQWLNHVVLLLLPLLYPQLDSLLSATVILIWYGHWYGPYRCIEHQTSLQQKRNFPGSRNGQFSCKHRISEWSHEYSASNPTQINELVFTCTYTYMQLCKLPNLRGQISALRTSMCFMQRWWWHSQVRFIHVILILNPTILQYYTITRSVLNNKRK